MLEKMINFTCLQIQSESNMENKCCMLMTPNFYQMSGSLSQTPDLYPNVSMAWISNSNLQINISKNELLITPSSKLHHLFLHVFLPLYLEIPSHQFLTRTPWSSFPLHPLSNSSEIWSPSKYIKNPITPRFLIHLPTSSL